MSSTITGSVQRLMMECSEKTVLYCRGCLNTVKPKEIYSFTLDENRDLYVSCTTIKVCLFPGGNEFCWYSPLAHTHCLADSTGWPAPSADLFRMLRQVWAMVPFQVTVPRISGEAAGRLFGDGGWRETILWDGQSQGRTARSLWGPGEPGLLQLWGTRRRSTASGSTRTNNTGGHSKPPGERETSVTGSWRDRYRDTTMSDLQWTVLRHLDPYANPHEAQLDSMPVL